MDQSTNKDFTIEEYRSFKIYSDVKMVKKLTKDIGMNKGKGYSSPMISAVIEGERTNEKIWSLYIEVVQNRLNFFYNQKIKRENNLIKKKLVSKKTWAKIVADFKAA